MCYNYSRKVGINFPNKTLPYNIFLRRPDESRGVFVEKCRILGYNKEKIFRGILCQRKSLQYYFY